MSREHDRAKKARRLAKKPLRRCLSMHECCFCDRGIKLGDWYRDGGHGSRAHVACVKASELSETPSCEGCGDPATRETTALRLIRSRTKAIDADVSAAAARRVAPALRFT